MLLMELKPMEPLQRQYRAPVPVHLPTLLPYRGCSQHAREVWVKAFVPGANGKQLPVVPLGILYSSLQQTEPTSWDRKGPGPILK